MTAKHLKGELNLNPTTMVMKQGSEQARAERSKPLTGRTGGARMPEAHEAAADLEGVEEQVHNPAHPAMQTRHSHHKEIKHADGRKHEDDHHAVRKLKGIL